jgi:hypothetical protein
MSPSTDTHENREFASEIKFFVDPATAAQIRDWARARLAPDPNASGASGDAYQITSLYFDTKQLDVFHRRGSFGRSKYRIRRYGQAEIAFLERKLKTRSLLTKRRSIVKLDELAQLAGVESENDWAGHWFHRRLQARGLKPVCQIKYHRTARVAMTNYGPIRLTLDEGVRALHTNELFFNDTQEGTALTEGRIILELKYRFEMPLLFKLLIEEFALNPGPISKYRLAAVALGYAAEPITNAPGNRPVGAGVGEAVEIRHPVVHDLRHLPPIDRSSFLDPAKSSVFMEANLATNDYPGIAFQKQLLGSIR